ncbi:hypothetical protein MCHI_002384 [Candidatus Magnetoovum chiemensis]|nr:hypothetical protein MCHI_002384 [Candidatus Magnetoovum chiemensis]
MLKHIFNGQQAGDSAIFIDHQGNVISVQSKIMKQHIQAFAFWNEDCRAQHVAQIDIRIGVYAKQVFGQQDSDYIVTLALIHRETGMRLFNGKSHDLVDRVFRVDRIHLGAGHHDVAC